MNIDWSKAPEGYDYHINWSDISAAVQSGFYREDGARYVREDGKYTTKNDLRLNGLKLTKRPSVVAETQAYTGEGLPPVGTVCEWFSDSARGWLTVNIAYQSSWVVVVQDTKTRPGNAEHGPTDIALEIDRDHPKFRPIRTAEQIAAEERDAAVSQMVEVIRERRFAASSPENPQGEATLAAEALYDAGYRKQEQK